MILGLNMYLIKGIIIGFFVWPYKHMRQQRTSMHAATYDPVVKFFEKKQHHQPVPICLCCIKKMCMHKCDIVTSHANFRQISSISEVFVRYILDISQTYHRHIFISGKWRPVLVHTSLNYFATIFLFEY